MTETKNRVTEEQPDAFQEMTRAHLRRLAMVICDVVLTIHGKNEFPFALDRTPTLEMGVNCIACTLDEMGLLPWPDAVLDAPVGAVAIDLAFYAVLITEAFNREEDLDPSLRALRSAFAALMAGSMTDTKNELSESLGWAARAVVNLPPRCCSAAMCAKPAVKITVMGGQYCAEHFPAADAYAREILSFQDRHGFS